MIQQDGRATMAARFDSANRRGRASTRLGMWAGALLAAVQLCHLELAPAQAQDYPTRPIRIVLPFAAGGGTDLLARLLAQRFHEAMGQPATVDNRIGAGGNIGAEIVVKSPPDGHTLMVSTASTEQVQWRVMGLAG